MALSTAQIEQQKKQAEELLFSGPQHLGFAKALFFGQFNAGLLFPYPELRPEVRAETRRAIGIRSLILFGADEQKRRWLPDLCSGKKLAAFALTEEEAGSDAGNVQTTATPTEDGKGFILNGGKKWITNGGIADVLTVMA